MLKTFWHYNINLSFFQIILLLKSKTNLYTGDDGIILRKQESSISTSLGLVTCDAVCHFFCFIRWHPKQAPANRGMPRWREKLQKQRRQRQSEPRRVDGKRPAFVFCRRCCNFDHILFHLPPLPDIGDSMYCSCFRVILIERKDDGTSMPLMKKNQNKENLDKTSSTCKWSLLKPMPRLFQDKTRMPNQHFLVQPWSFMFQVVVTWSGSSHCGVCWIQPKFGHKSWSSLLKYLCFEANWRRRKVEPVQLWMKTWWFPQKSVLLPIAIKES